MRKKNGICYIVGAGEEFVPFAPQKGDLVIAADGGCNTLAEHGIRPDLLVGDLDSVTVPFDGDVIRYPVHKDETDTAIAYRIGRGRGYARFVFLACVGGRAAHTYANYTLLAAIHREGVRAVLVGQKENVLFMKSESLTLSRPEGRYLSLFAFGGRARGVTLTGLSYSLSEAVLSPESHIGVSNAFCNEPATITVANGGLLVFCERRAGDPIALDLLDGFQK